MKFPSPRRPGRAPDEGSGNVRLAAGLLLLGALYGCGAGGFIPGGPHAMDAVRLASIVDANARATGLSPKLVSAMISVESHGDPAAVSRAGAQGLMQLMPDTATTYGVANAFDPDQNVNAGCRYMRDLLRRYHNNVSLALAAYNAGPGSVDATHGIPAFPETRAYVARVSAALHSSTTL
jgi:soluble lytic murein transglycosylase-like protein